MPFSFLSKVRAVCVRHPNAQKLHALALLQHAVALILAEPSGSFGGLSLYTLHVFPLQLYGSVAQVVARHLGFKLSRPNPMHPYRLSAIFMPKVWSSQELLEPIRIVLEKNRYIII